MRDIQRSEKTRAKLIEAAGKLFAEKGLSGVTVRDIAQKAETPLGAISYHFKTKEILYKEVLLEACRVDSITPDEQAQLKKMDSYKALLIIVKEAVKKYQKQGASNWRTVVLSRETLTPSSIFKELVNVFYKPQIEFIAEITGSIVGKPATDKQVLFSVLCMIGLIDTFGLYDQLIEAVSPDLDRYIGKKDRLAKQITDLVIAAAKGDVSK
ncbi:MAG: TetR/AcrR family transcriptional regulator [Desulfobacteraceae bacterium]|jgi:AcrR family transcriptional regulator